ncbi:MAG TPA: hypothetical protein VJW75_11405, partial [Candidatus Eisenbacteria bacterium]|nr:hypothetical protein [Candidatus Eisenbacteria bacterium]
HARGCPGCDQAIAAAVAIEALLAGSGAALPVASAGFTDAVMARIDAEPKTARTEAPIAAAPPWWLVLAAEPATAVALALVPTVLAIAFFVPSVRDALVSWVRLATTSSVSATLSGISAVSTDTTGFLNAMSPAARTLLAVGLVPVLLWGWFAAPTWLASSLSSRRASPPRSRT